MSMTIWLITTNAGDGSNGCSLPPNSQACASLPPTCKRPTKMWLAVKHEHRDGWHTFTSPQLPGLCVASTDLQKAYKDVACC
jgi:hypothetical protein